MEDLLNDIKYLICSIESSFSVQNKVVGTLKHGTENYGLAHAMAQDETLGNLLKHI